MKILVKYSIVILFFISLTACESEPITDIAKIEKELKIVIKNNGINKCSVIEYDSDLKERVIYSNHDFSVKGGCLIIFSTHLSGEEYELRYNLLNISKYEFANNYVYFYFSTIKKY